MDNTRILTLKKTDILVFSILLIAATLAPLAGNQFVSGTIVNCTLILSVCTLGIGAALLVGIIPSTIALATGLLPAVLAPMIPFIILGNAGLVIVLDQLRKINYWLGAVGGSVLKFGLLTGVSSVVIGLLIDKNLAANVAYMMSWPQLVTALAGGIVSFGILYLKNK
jgi:hypothetical protein